MIRRRFERVENYAISSGSKTFDVETYLGREATTIQIFYTGLDTEDVTVSVEQSLDGVNFDLLTRANKQLESAQPSHTFNIVGLRTDHIQIRLDVGTATTGTIDKIIYLYN